ncbi:MAG: TetR/AcrR family transcriptional regulator [Chloroflexaceae bacterium]
MDKQPTYSRRERKDMRRNMQRVLQAAHDLFTERGAEVTMEEVARQAGVGVGTIYRRFPSKEHLLAAVGQEVRIQVQHGLHQAIQTQSDPLGKLRALILTLYRYGEKYAILFELQSQVPPVQQPCEHTEKHRRIYATLHALFTTIMTEGQQQGVIRQEDPAILATFCLELVHPRTFVNFKQVVNGDAEVVADCVTRLLLAGVAAQSEVPH